MECLEGKGGGVAGGFADVVVHGGVRFVMEPGSRVLKDPELLEGGGDRGSRGESTAGREPSMGGVVILSVSRGKRESALAGNEDQRPRPACGGDQDDNSDNAVSAWDAVLG